MKTRTLVERCERYWEKHCDDDLFFEEHIGACIRAELQRVARQVRKIRKEVNAPTCEVDAGYKTALNDVLEILREAQR